MLGLNITAVTQKGQVTLPKKLRDKFFIVSRDSVKIEDGGDFIKITKIPTLMDLAGKYKPRKNKGVDPVKAREYMETHYKRV